jgi:hypothetical protein
LENKEIDNDESSDSYDDENDEGSEESYTSDSD